jgi:LAO/AO transport system kinase
MEKKISELIVEIKQKNWRSLAKAITIVENELSGSEEILKSINFNHRTPVIGITGPPGAGKSTIVNALVEDLLQSPNNTIGIVAIDPTSPFNFGSVLGDRVRMAQHFNNDRVYIRSIATRGSLGGLSGKTIEISDVMQLAGFSHIIIETVGVGQSEIEIVGLADATILVLVPEAGDEVQTIKSGIMEIADIFVVNKSDRNGANTFVKNLAHLVHKKHGENYASQIIKSVATKNEGIQELNSAIVKHLSYQLKNSKKTFLLAEKAFELIQHKMMKRIDKKDLIERIEIAKKNNSFNLYVFVNDYLI